MKVLCKKYMTEEQFKKYIRYNQTKVDCFVIKHCKTKHYSYDDFLNLFKIYKNGFFEWNRFSNRLQYIIDTGDFKKFLNDFMKQEKTGKSQYFCYEEKGYTDRKRDYEFKGIDVEMKNFDLTETTN